VKRTEHRDGAPVFDFYANGHPKEGCQRVPGAGAQRKDAGGYRRGNPKEGCQRTPAWESKGRRPMGVPHGSRVEIFLADEQNRKFKTEATV